MDSLRRAAFALVLEDDATIVVCTGMGQLTQLRLGSDKTTAASSLGRLSTEYANVPMRDWPLSSNHDRVYIGVNVEPREDGLASKLVVLSVSTGEETARLNPSLPFWSVLPGRHDQLIYMFSPYAKTLLVMDLGSGRELRRITGLGNSPALGFLVP
jgi:hypothetical protein